VVSNIDSPCAAFGGIEVQQLADLSIHCLQFSLDQSKHLRLDYWFPVTFRSSRQASVRPLIPPLEISEA
jgi:hypothetical protein